MSDFTTLLLLLLAATLLGTLAKVLPWPAPITWVLGGIGLATAPEFLRESGLVWLPLFPQVRLDPGIFFLCFLPPLLFADGWLMPLRDFRAAARPILLLSIGLVLFTTLAVGFTAHWLVPELPLAMALALGALVSPTDAVAVAAITERLKVPHRLGAILNGESLMNDATGLVAFKVALGALAVGSFSVKSAAWEFIVLAAGGLATGALVAWLVGLARDGLIRARASDHHTEVTLSLLTPFAAYLASDTIGVSAVMGVVAAGLYSGWRDPLRLSAQTRQHAWSVWSILLYWLNGSVFLLLGLQFPEIYADVRDDFTLRELLLFSGVISAVVILSRVLWFFPGAYLPFVLSRTVRESETPPTWQSVLVGSWAGMRGAVTLAAALSIPIATELGAEFPGRNLVIFLSFAVILATLVLQGTTLESLIRILKVGDGGAREREEVEARITAVWEGLQVLRRIDRSTLSPVASRALEQVVFDYTQRLDQLRNAGETSQAATLHLEAEEEFRGKALAAERSAVERLWKLGVINDETLHPMLRDLDASEASMRNRFG